MLLILQRICKIFDFLKLHILINLSTGWVALVYCYVVKIEDTLILLRYSSHTRSIAMSC